MKHLNWTFQSSVDKQNCSERFTKNAFWYAYLLFYVFQISLMQIVKLLILGHPYFNYKYFVKYYVFWKIVLKIRQKFHSQLKPPMVFQQKKSPLKRNPTKKSAEIVKLSQSVWKNSTRVKSSRKSCKSPCKSVSILTWIVFFESLAEYEIVDLSNEAKQNNAEWIPVQAKVVGMK